MGAFLEVFGQVFQLSDIFCWRSIRRSQLLQCGTNGCILGGFRAYFSTFPYFPLALYRTFPIATMSSNAQYMRRKRQQRWYFIDLTSMQFPCFSGFTSIEFLVFTCSSASPIQRNALLRSHCGIVEHTALRRKSCFYSRRLLAVLVYFVAGV